VSNTTCSTEGCERTHYGRTLCKFHYQRAWLAGEIENYTRGLVRVGATLAERLEHHGWKVQPWGCWEWQGSLNGRGYGQMAAGGDRPLLVPRAAYMAWVGPIPNGMIVRHTCDNPPCFRPEHLVLGTRADNTRDAVVRQRVANGERKPHKLTDLQVAEIRSRYAGGGETQMSLANEYGVSPSLVGMIANGKRRGRRTNPPLRSPAELRRETEMRLALQPAARPELDARTYSHSSGSTRDQAIAG